MQKLLLALAIIFIISMSSLLLLQNTAGMKKQTPIHPTETISITPTATPVTNKYEFTAADSGKTAIFSVTSRFGLILNGNTYPRNNMKVACKPNNVLGSISNIPAVALPLYALRYEGVSQGTCTIINNNFILTVIIR